MDVAAPEVSKTEDYVKSDEFKNLNDSKLAFDLEREGKVVYHFAVKRRVNGGKLNESEQEMVFNVICRLLLEELGLDETDAEHGSVDTPEPTAEQMKLGDANITGNKDDDAKVRKVVDAQVEKMKLLKKTQKELKPKCLKVFQNAIYETIKERSLDVGSVSLNMRIGTYFTGDEKTNEEEQIREVVRSVIEGSAHWRHPERNHCIQHRNQEQPDSGGKGGNWRRDVASLPVCGSHDVTARCRLHDRPPDWREGLA